MKKYTFFITVILLISCNNNSQTQENLQEKITQQHLQIHSLKKKNKAVLYKIDSLLAKIQAIQNTQKKILQATDTTMIAMNKLDTINFLYDLRYASTNNFTKTKIYDCTSCFVQFKVVKALLKANADFIKKGYKIKFFDCFRTVEAQKKLWKIYPDARYVANPKVGSIHNKGGAVDITLVDLNGNELDMGTAYDHFGEEAHHAYTNFSDEVLANRKLLRETMEKHGFWTIRTEWWHYNYKNISARVTKEISVDCEE